HLIALGFSDFRIRTLGYSAKIQLPSKEFDKLPENRAAIVKELKKYYDEVLLDLEMRA
ncbi:MAG: TIGR00268 family protein, partial [Clostridiales bacterium]|nr:TIGR00268 family protein [Clostridiales bacterium]